MEYKKAMFSLPAPLLKKLSKYADSVADGNKSGFVAQALEAYMEYVRKAYHTAKMREAYEQSAGRNRRLLREWQDVDAEMLNRLETLDEQDISEKE